MLEFNILISINTSSGQYMVNSCVVEASPNEQNINNYNALLLLAWQANMDIQYVLDAYACVMYVAIIHNEDRAINVCC